MSSNSSLTARIFTALVLLLKGNSAPAKTDQSRIFPLPTGNIAEFALAKNADHLDPKVVSPNVKEIGLPRLTISSRSDSSALASFNLLAIQIPVPNGWYSVGGFSCFDKVFLTRVPYSKADLVPLPNFGLKVLDSTPLGTHDLKGVLKKVEEMTKRSAGYSDIQILVLEKEKMFVVESGTVLREDGAVASQLDLYYQDPTPDSKLWVDIQMAANKDEFQKLKGLLGAMVKDMKIDWKELARVIALQ